MGRPGPSSCAVFVGPDPLSGGVGDRATGFAVRAVLLGVTATLASILDSGEVLSMRSKTSGDPELGMVFRM